MGQAENIYNVLRQQVGYKEGSNNANKFAKETVNAGVAPWSWDHQQWCQIFQSWGAWKTNLLNSHYPNTASCGAAVTWFRNRGWFSFYPAVGAQVFFGAGGGSHVEFVYKYDANYIYTVGGNTGPTGGYNSDGVYLHKIARNASRVYGYGCPAFTEGRVAADPKWGGQKSGSVTSGGGTTTPTSPAAHPISLSDVKPGLTNVSIHRMQWALKAEVGLDFTSGPGTFGPKTQEAYAKWQRKLGYSGSDADGIPGIKSLTALANKHGYTVVK